VFVEIVERGSMIAAAEYLDMSRSMVTRYLAEIENWANARLLHRSTRRLSLTPAGEQVLERCHALLQVAQDIPLALESPANVPSGLLRISCSGLAAEHILMPTIERFTELYPKVSIELIINNATLNLVEERIDLAVRIASELDPNLIARPLGVCESALCASPSYLEKMGSPTSLQALSDHACLIYSYFGKHGLWSFMDKDVPMAVPVTGTFIANDSEVLLSATLRGMGISCQPLLAVEKHFESGELINLLPQYQPISMGIYGVYRSRKHMPQALRLLLDMLVE
jgi:DNA-binding transcriptional LysR family regulator